MFKSCLFVGALALVLMLPSIPADAQGDRRSAAEAYARVVDYRLLIEKAATRRAAELPASEREAFIEFVTGEVDFDMTRFYATSAMVDLFEASELQALASFAATPEGRSALAKLPAPRRDPQSDRRAPDRGRRAGLSGALTELEARVSTDRCRSHYRILKRFGDPGYEPRARNQAVWADPARG
jgi:hypothetical protein